MQNYALGPVTWYSPLHTNASGDFALMAKEHWFALRAHPECEMYSFDLDSVLCHAGVRKKNVLNSRPEEKGIHKLTNEFTKLATQMRRERRYIPFNEENWRLVDHHLPESEIHG